MQWQKLESVEQLQALTEESKKNSVLIFKHSTRCNISRMALDRLEREWRPEEMKDVKTYFLDLLSYRDMSSAVAEKFSVEHQSPQVLLIENGEAVYDQSHFEIHYKDIAAATKKVPTN
jgi:bacillithiol system protein YtxJ